MPLKYNVDTVCNLCSSRIVTNFVFAHGRQYLHCSNCELVFMASADRLSLDDECERYKLHTNSPADPDYRRHLSKAIDPLIAFLDGSSYGLDFGSGPGPTTSVMFKEKGITVRNYDPFFANDEGALNDQYNFVICTETAEHFFNPCREFELLNELIKQNGYLSLMTQIYEPNLSFDSWWYSKDPTHVTFYSRKSLQWIANNWSWKIMSSSDCVHIFQKQCPQNYSSSQKE